MRQEIHVESFKDFIGKSTNNDIDSVLSKELLGSGIKKRYVADTTLKKEQAEKVKEGMFIPQYLKVVELEDGRVFQQKINIIFDDEEDTSMVAVEWKENKNSGKKL